MIRPTMWEGVDMEQRFGPLAADIEIGNPVAPPLVLLHGLTFNRSMWQPIRVRLASADPARTVVAFDLPGHGGSDRQPDYRAEAVAARVHDAVNEAELAPPVVVGHSVGGLVATVYAARYETRGVVNVDQPLDVTEFAALVRSLEDRLRGDDFPDLWRMFEASLHAEVLPAEMQELVRSITHVDRDVVLGYWSQIFELPIAALHALVDDALAAIRDTRVPYVYVSGTTPESSYVQWLTMRLPDVEIIGWPDTGHFPHLARPDAFADILTSTAAW